MEIVISSETPSIQMHVCTLYSFLGQLAKLSGALIEADQLMVFGGLVFVIIAGFRLDVIQNAGVNYRRANKFASFKSAMSSYPISV